MNMKELLLKQGIEEEQADAIVKGMKENKMYITSEENLDERYTKLKAQKEDLENQITTKDELITDLKNSTKSSDELQTKISEYETEIEQLQNQSKELQKQSAVEIALVKQGARNTKAVNALLDFEKIEVGEKGVEGLEEQLETLKESDAYLFQSSEEDTPRIINEEGHQGNSDDDIDPFEEVVSKY